MRREYPAGPVVAVGAIVVSPGVDSGFRVLLVRRGHEPHQGEWSIPGGAVELAETLDAALRREVLEETGLTVEPVALVEVLDRIVLDAEGLVQYHYVLIDSLCTVRGGTLACASDALEAAWVEEKLLAGHAVKLPEFTLAVIRKAIAMARSLDLS